MGREGVGVNVSRGLLATERRSLRALAPRDPEIVAGLAFDRLSTEPAGGYAWKERVQWASRLARGDGDEFGRRLLTDAGKADARYIARVSRRALHGRTPEGKIELGHLRSSLRRIMVELGVH